MTWQKVRPKYGRTAHIVAAVLVFAVFLSASLYYWYSQRQSVSKDMGIVYQREIRSTQDAIDQRMSTYEDIMRGGRGLFEASDSVKRDEWRRFIAEYDIQNRYPGVQGFGFSEFIPKDQLADDTAAIQADGAPNFSIRAVGGTTLPADPTEYTALIYLEPQTSQTAASFGVDMTSDPVRRKAMYESRDSGNIAVTSRIVIPAASEPKPDARTAFVMFLAVYDVNQPHDTVADRQASLQGYVFAPFRTNYLFNNILGDAPPPSLGVGIYDGTKVGDDTLLYKTSNYDTIAAGKDVMMTTAPLTIAGHRWTMAYAGSPDLLSTTDRQRPALALMRGVFSSLFFAGLIYYLLTWRSRKLIRQQEAEVQGAKDDLLSLASHQLRTPATVVKQYVGMLLHGYAGTVPKQQQTMLQKAYDSNERQLEIINQILYVARLDAGKIRLTVVPFDLKAELSYIAADYKSVLKDRNQKLTKEFPRRNLQMEGDSQYLRMVFDNLLSNASKYTPEGGNISVKLSSEGKDAVIVIKDDGVGIDQGELESVFDKFTRVDNELSTQAGGSGIGLYLARQIVNLHGGDISTQSAPNRGSTFTVRLPLHQPPPQDELNVKRKRKPPKK